MGSTMVAGSIAASQLQRHQFNPQLGLLPLQFGMFFPCPYAFCLGFLVSFHLIKNIPAGGLATLIACVCTVTGNGLASHSGCLIASRPVFLGRAADSL